MTWQLVLTHLTAAGAGAAMTWWLVVRPIAARFDKLEEVSLMPHAPQSPREAADPRRWTAVTWVLIAVAVLLVLAIQMFLAQRDNAERARDQRETMQCIADWADDFAQALDKRTGASGKTAQAARNRDNALDNLLVRAVTEPPPDRAELEPLIDNYLAARRTYLRQAERQEKVRDRVQYPDPPNYCTE